MTGASNGVAVFNALLTATCDTFTPSAASRSRMARKLSPASRNVRMRAIAACSAASGTRPPRSRNAAAVARVDVENIEATPCAGSDADQFGPRRSCE